MPVYFKGSKITPIVKDTSLFKKLADGSITEVTAEDLAGVTRIKSFAFANCQNLQSIVIPDSVTDMGQQICYESSNLTNVTLSSNCPVLGILAFGGCVRLTSIAIPNSVRSISYGTFRDCSGLTNVTIGNGVTYIGQQAFANCSGLTSVTIKATTPPALQNVNAFDNTNNCPIYVPAESVDAYKAATNWSSLADRIFAIS